MRHRPLELEKQKNASLLRAVCREWKRYREGRTDRERDMGFHGLVVLSETADHGTRLWRELDMLIETALLLPTVTP